MTTVAPSAAGALAGVDGEGQQPVTPRDLQYRPHLDGLRAVAVYLVVLFHAGYSRLSGGYVGVDVFFVLSGYLVTLLLLRDVAARSSIAFARFYARRYRRLLPAAFVALVVSATVYSAIASPADALSSVNAFKAAFLYVANWFFVHRSTAYFGGNIAQNPVLHFWSLAVEEQFYLVWPLVLGALFAIARGSGIRRTRTIQAIVAGSAVVSLAWALYLRHASPAHAYYGTDARAYQLLAGALLALTPGIIDRARRVRAVARALPAIALLALLLLATSWVHLDAIERGAAVVLASVAIITALEASDRGVVKAVLSSGPLVYLGRISYGTYLWHWPVILVMAQLLHLSTIATVALTLLVATSIASLSHQLLERPVRESRLLERHRNAVIAAGLAISMVSALVIVPAILRPTSSSASAVRVGSAIGTPVPAGLDWARATFSALPPNPVCYGRPPGACTTVHGRGRRLLLIGDSSARMLIPTFAAVARRDNLTLSVISLGDCPWQRHLYSRIDTAQCRKLKEDAYTRVIPALAPDVIVAVNYGYESPTNTLFPIEGLVDENGHTLARGSPAFDAEIERTTVASASDLTRRGGRLVLIESLPRARSIDPTACIRHSRFVEPCRFVASTAPTSVDRLYRRIAAGNSHILSADFARLACPFLPICDPVVAGLIVRVDPYHFSFDYARYIAPQVDEYLRANRLVGGGG